MSQEKKSTVGDPIWVESLMNAQELQEAHRLYPNTVRHSKHFEYDANYYKGGTWRAGMGRNLTPVEIALFNHNFDKLTDLLKTKKFQKKPDYGPHAEAKP
jgi:hypothetical protein